LPQRVDQRLLREVLRQADVADGDATTRGNSMRKTASTAAVESVAGTPPIQPPRARHEPLSRVVS